MRKTALISVIAALLLCITIAPGCDVEVDWEDVAKKAVAEWVGSAVITAIDKYSGEVGQDIVVEWVLDQAEDVAFLEPYLEYINLEAMVKKAYKIVWHNIYAAARWAGMDVDADGPNDKFAWHVTPSNPKFGNLVDELVDMI